jgi:NAD(P)-dependent dehydrogenase (short-subunit alcohol dehydrogenase family)
VIITKLNAESGRQAELELSALGQVRSVRCDGTDRADVDALLDDIWRNEGPLDLVFSNAGTGGW